MDHYRTLQVTRDAEPEVIERAFRALALKYHPDTANSSVSTAEKMRCINAAYDVLRDPSRRKLYDRALESESPSAWELFLDRGLVGLFIEHSRNRS